MKARLRVCNTAITVTLLSFDCNLHFGVLPKTSHSTKL